MNGDSPTENKNVGDPATLVEALSNTERRRISCPLSQGHYESNTHTDTLWLCGGGSSMPSRTEKCDLRGISAAASTKNLGRGTLVLDEPRPVLPEIVAIEEVRMG